MKVDEPAGSSEQHSVCPKILEIEGNEIKKTCDFCKGNFIKSEVAFCYEETLAHLYCSDKDIPAAGNEIRQRAQRKIKACFPLVPFYATNEIKKKSETNEKITKWLDSFEDYFPDLQNFSRFIVAAVHFLSFHKFFEGKKKSLTLVIRNLCKFVCRLFEYIKSHTDKEATETPLKFKFVSEVIRGVIRNSIDFEYSEVEFKIAALFLKTFIHKTHRLLYKKNDNKANKVYFPLMQTLVEVKYEKYIEEKKKS